MAYDPEKAAKICEVIASSERSLGSICREFGITRATFYNWKAESEELFDRYARAKEDQGDFLAEQILPIADDQDRDPNCRRLSIDARKWYAAKLKPKKYGDKISQEVSGPEGGPIEIVNTLEIVAPDLPLPSDEQSPN